MTACEDHGTGEFTLGETGEELLFDFFGGVGVDGFADALEAVDVH